MGKKKTIESKVILLRLDTGHTNTGLYFPRGFKNQEIFMGQPVYTWSKTHFDFLLQFLTNSIPLEIGVYAFYQIYFISKHKYFCIFTKFWVSSCFTI